MPETATAQTGEPRFAFGENWLRFLENVDDAKIETATEALKSALGVDDLIGRTFLDAGSGSGLFSLAALRLGAERVHSFDYDPDSVRCTAHMKDLNAPGSARWTIEQGDVTDRAYCASLGTFDVVYCFGVLHHTGAMWSAMDNLTEIVAPGGLMYLSIYNSQGELSVMWSQAKRLYNKLPPRLRPFFAALVWAPFEIKHAVLGAIYEPREYLHTWTRRKRGMSKWHDIVDWVGGYPFEVARPEEVVDRCRNNGFELIGLATVGGRSACNQFLFRRPTGGD